MKVLRGTRWPALAAACAMLIVGAGAADAPATPLFPAAAYFLSVPVDNGVDGCPELLGSTFDPRELCAADLGSGWTPYGVVDVQLCPPGSTVLGAGLMSGTVHVDERIITEPDAASAIADVRTRATCDLKDRSNLHDAARELPSLAIAGAAAEAQVATDLPDVGGGIGTFVAIGNVVLVVGVSDDRGVPDSASVMRIVNAAIGRFQNPRRLVIVPVPRSALPSPP